jgi:hypothetical protein
MGSLVELVLTILQMIAEMVFGSSKKEADSKKIPLKNMVLIIICMALFMVTISAFVGWLFTLVKPFFNFNV